MTNLFKRAVSFTDIHLGLRHNSPVHNQDCVDYIQWLIDQAKTLDAETCIFMGDFFHHRNQINLQTLNFSLRVFQMLNDGFENVYFLVGNHDLFYKENRSISSTKFAGLFPNIHLIDQIETRGGVSLVPWMVGDEWKSISRLKCQYLFGHLEIPGFKMNAQIEMPDHGQINARHFKYPSYVFSGHFHKRQNQGNIHYIGNPFGHNYSDVGDFDRGAMFLEWGGAPQYLNYTQGPRFVSIPLSQLLSDPESVVTPQTYLQVTLDMDITYEEASVLRETFIETYQVREFKLVQSRAENPEDPGGLIEFKSVDQIVTEQLAMIESESYDRQLLIDMYNGL